MPQAQSDISFFASQTGSLCCTNCLSCLCDAQVQMDIRKGHAQTVEKVLNWVDEEGSLEGISVCDAGCGTGG